MFTISTYAFELTKFKNLKFTFPVVVYLVLVLQEEGSAD